MPNREDSSVRIGENATISNSAVGRGASVHPPNSNGPNRKPLLIFIGSAVFAIVVGWVTNALYDWTAGLWHLFGHGSKP
jgi:hypothetical protein